MHNSIVQIDENELDNITTKLKSELNDFLYGEGDFTPHDDVCGFEVFCEDSDLDIITRIEEKDSKQNLVLDLIFNHYIKEEKSKDEIYHFETFREASDFLKSLYDSHIVESDYNYE